MAPRDVLLIYRSDQIVFTSVGQAVNCFIRSPGGVDHQRLITMKYTNCLELLSATKNSAGAWNQTAFSMLTTHQMSRQRTARFCRVASLSRDSLLERWDSTGRYQHMCPGDCPKVGIRTRTRSPWTAPHDVCWHRTCMFGVFRGDMRSDPPKRFEVGVHRVRGEVQCIDKSSEFVMSIALWSACAQAFRDTRLGVTNAQTLRRWAVT